MQLTQSIMVLDQKQKKLCMIKELRRNDSKTYLYASAMCKQPGGKSFLSIVGSRLCLVSDTIYASVNPFLTDGS